MYIISSLEPDNGVKLKTKLGRLFGSLPGYLNHQYDTPTPEVELMYQVYLVSIRNVHCKCIWMPLLLFNLNLNRVC